MRSVLLNCVCFLFTIIVFLFSVCSVVVVGQGYPLHGDPNDWNYHSPADPAWNTEVTTYTFVNIKANLTSLFLDSIGINVHGTNYEGAYSKYPDKIYQYLKDAKILHLRQQLGANGQPTTFSDLVNLGEMGFKFTLLVDNIGLTPEQQHENIKQLNLNFTSRGLEPVVIAVEGPNEPDNFWEVCCDRDYNLTYKGQGFPEGPLLFLNDTYTAFKNDSTTSWITVVGIASGNNNPYATNHINMSGFVDWGNAHPYPFGGNSQSYPFNYTNIAKYYWRGNFPSVNIDEWNYYYLFPLQAYPGRPLMTTESGYKSISQDIVKQPLFPFVTFDVQAKYIPRIYAEYFRLGIKRLLLYEAADEDVLTSDDYINQDIGWGLLDGNANPKPAYFAIKSLLNLIADKNNTLPPYPQSNNQEYRDKLNQNNVVLNYTINVTQVAYPSTNIGCVSYGNWCNIYYRMYFVHHILLQRPSTNDIFFLIWHEISNMDLNPNDYGLPPLVVTHPPIPLEIIFTGGIGLDVKNLSSAVKSTLYNYDSNYNLQASSVEFTAPNTIQLNALDTISVLQLQTKTSPSEKPSPSKLIFLVGILISFLYFML